RPLGSPFAEAAARNGGVTRPAGPDAAVAAFPRATDALQAALQLRAAFDTERPCLLVHTGEVQVHGWASDAEALVERAVRLVELGHPGQILVSQPAHDLVADDLA